MGRPVERGLGRPHRSKLRDIRATNRDQTTLTRSQRKPTVGSRPIAEAEQRRYTGVIRLTRFTTLVILEEERHAGERCIVFDPFRVGASPLELTMNDRIQQRVETFDSFDRGLNQLTRMHLPAVNEVRQRCCIKLVVPVHRLILSVRDSPAIDEHGLTRDERRVV